MKLPRSEKATIISFAYPARNEDLLMALGEKKVNFLVWIAYLVSRAQSMDALSSWQTPRVTARVVEASHRFGRFTGQITAAGKVPPAKILVIGGGGRRFGGHRSGPQHGCDRTLPDTRPAVKEESIAWAASFLSLISRRMALGPEDMPR